MRSSVMRIVDIFEDNSKFLLIGDVHVNSMKFAIACEEAGADAVVLHLNHDAPGGGRFGGWEIEEQSIRESIGSIKIPAGISIGDNRLLLPSDWEAIVSLQFSFVNMFAHHMPSFILADNRISKVISIGPGYVFEQIKSISASIETSALMAAVTPAQGVGLPLTLLDLTTLGLITSLSEKPVMMPTQRAIRPEDIALIQKQNCKGIVISSTVYGESPDGCREQIELFRKKLSNPVRNI